MLALDSNILIYFFERNPRYYQASERIMLDLLHGRQQAVCSTIIITELFAGNPRFDMRSLDISCLRLAALDKDTAIMAGKLSNKYALKAPDAIHLATAIQASADEFITNDQQLLKKKISEVKVHGLKDG